MLRRTGERVREHVEQTAELVRKSDALMARVFGGVQALGKRRLSKQHEANAFVSVGEAPNAREAMIVSRELEASTIIVRIAPAATTSPLCTSR